MTQLVKHESAISLSGNTFAAALAAKPVKNSSDFEIAEAISSAIEKAVFDMGLRQMSDDDFNLLKFGILNEVKTSFTTLTIDEIKNAFHYGVRGKYGEVFGLNVAQAAKWMSSYMTDHSRVEARKELAKANEQKVVPGQDEKFNTAKKLCLDAYQMVKNNAAIGLTAGTVYTFIDSLGLMASEYKKGVMKDALQLLINEKEKEVAFSTELIRRRQMSTDLECLRQNVANDILTPDQHEQVKRLAKREAITNYLRDISLDDTDLAELIEGKREFYKGAK